MERAPFIKRTAFNGDAGTSGNPIQARKLFVLSANDKVACETLMKNIAIYLEQRPEIFQNDLLSNVAYTLGQRRSLLQWRVAIPAVTSFELIQSLSEGKITPVKENEPLRIGFVFTGQGAQWFGMGRELYEQYPTFAYIINWCDSLLTALGAPFSLARKCLKEMSF
jgi:acyl transferase domain-containing protein